MTQYNVNINPCEDINVNTTSTTNGDYTITSDQIGVYQSGSIYGGDWGTTSPYMIPADTTSIMPSTSTWTKEQLDEMLTSIGGAKIDVRPDKRLGAGAAEIFNEL